MHLRLATTPARAGTRIAVVDSGVHAAHPHVHGIAGGCAIDASGCEHDDIVDRLGHGTAVAAAIREKAPGAEIFAVKIFDRALIANADSLVSAIAWSAKNRIRLANLSLGTPNAAHVTALQAAIQLAEAVGMLIVAAGEQDGVRWLPGSIDSPIVIPVTLDWTIPRDECVVTIDERGRVRMRASGYPRPIPGVDPARNLKGISFAVANATGLLARMLGTSDRPLADLRAALAPGAVSSS